MTIENNAKTNGFSSDWQEESFEERMARRSFCYIKYSGTIDGEMLRQNVKKPFFFCKQAEPKLTTF